MTQPETILTSRGTPFTSRAYAEKNLPDGYVAVERDGGWVGVKKIGTGPEFEDLAWFLSVHHCNQHLINKTLSDAELIDLEPDEPKESVPNYSGLDVICPGCGQSYYETTKLYDPDRNANSAMIRLKEKYRAWGWEELIPDHASGYGCLVCPDCGTALASSGRLMIE